MVAQFNRVPKDMLPVLSSNDGVLNPRDNTGSHSVTSVLCNKMSILYQFNRLACTYITVVSKFMKNEQFNSEQKN